MIGPQPPQARLAGLHRPASRGVVGTTLLTRNTRPAALRWPLRRAPRRRRRRTSRRCRSASGRSRCPHAGRPTRWRAGQTAHPCTKCPGPVPGRWFRWAATLRGWWVRSCRSPRGAGSGTDEGVDVLDDSCVCAASPTCAARCVVGRAAPAGPDGEALAERSSSRAITQDGGAGQVAASMPEDQPGNLEPITPHRGRRVFYAGCFSAMTSSCSIVGSSKSSPALSPSAFATSPDRCACARRHRERRRRSRTRRGRTEPRTTSRSGFSFDDRQSLLQEGTDVVLPAGQCLEAYQKGFADLR